MKRRAVFLAVQIVLALGLTVSGAGGGRMPADAAPLAGPVVSVAGPWVSLGPMQAVGGLGSGTMTAQAVAARPLSLTTADFDIDGTVDLITGYGTATDGMLTLYRGSLGGSEDRYPVTFPAQTQLIPLPVAPDFLVATDFNADGIPDVVTAARDGNALWFLPGDGTGGLGSPQAVVLPGRLTALAVGELYRQDGLADIAVGVVTPEGARLLVFVGEQGAQTATPESYVLSSPVTALAIGQLDNDPAFDLAIASGNALSILRGRDQTVQEPVTAVLDSVSLGFTPISLALGDFVSGDTPTQEVALLDAEGQIHILVPDGSSAFGFELQATRMLATASVAPASLLLRAKTSSLPADDLLIVDSAGRVQVLTADGQRMTPEGSYAEATTPGLLAMPAAGAPVVAALPVRLNVDGLDDLVLLTEGSSVPSVLYTQAVHVFLINSRNDNPDKTPGDGICKSTDGYCTLRAAIMEANASAGFDDIVCNLSMSGEPPVLQPGSQLPDITETLLLEGGTRGTANCGKMEINGASAGAYDDGLLIRGGSTTVRNVAIYNYNSGVRIESSGNLVEASILGTDNDGTAYIGNTIGVRIESGDYNEVRSSILASNNHAGIRIAAGSQNAVRNGNMIGFWPDPPKVMPYQYYGVEVTGGSNARIGTIYAERNTISGNTYSGIYLGSGAGFSTVQANTIGVAQTGATLGNGIGVEVKGPNTIGGALAYQNFITGNTKEGISVRGIAAINNQITYNLIANAAGVANLGDGIKLSDGAKNNYISHNVIGNNGRHGVAIIGAGATCDKNGIRNNTIGTDDNKHDLGNAYDGVFVTGSSCNTIATNTIYHNSRHGINLDGTTSITATVKLNTCVYNGEIGLLVGANSSVVEENKLSYNGQVGMWVVGSHNMLNDNQAFGEDLAGTYQPVGIRIDGSHNTLTGGSIYAPQSEIAWHHGDGLEINGHFTTVKRYYIHSNWGAGIAIASNNNVIGAAGSDRNIISINDDGVRIAAGAIANQVIGNYIGTDLTGVYDAGNIVGVHVLGSGNQIGGAGENEGNRIGYSQGANIMLTGSGASSNVVEGNNIGPTVTSGAPGVKITDLAANNALRSNRISGSAGAGVSVISGTGNRLDRNLLTLNSGLGIDLTPTGVTFNDTGDTDGGANGLQNFPVISAVTAGDSSTRIQGTLSSKPGLVYLLQFYLNTSCDASGYGEGATYLGLRSVTTDSSGKAGFDVTFDVGGALDKYVTATATDPANSTSEFSKCSAGRPASSGTPFTVNTLGDAVDTNTADGICDSSATAGEQCTLRAAVQQANASVGADTIIVPVGTYPLTLSGLESSAAAGDLDVTDDLTLSGAGADATMIQSQVPDRVFEIRSGAVVTISGVTIAGGSIATSADGGGALVNTGTMLTLDDVSVQQNLTLSGSGGGIYSAGIVTLSNSSVVNNTAGAETNGGGGLFLEQGSATLRNVTVSGNQTKGNGGGIQNLVASVSLNNVTVVRNSADSDNDGGDGGGLYTGVSTFYVKNSIVAENLDFSHGVYPNGVADCSGTFTSQNYNLIGDQARQTDSSTPACAGFGGGTNDSVGGFWILTRYLVWGAGLGPLQLNGGSTPNHAPIASGAGLAVDLGNPAAPDSGANTCELFDQRGQPRPIDGGTDGIARCDRGAVEHVPAYLSIGDASVVEGGVAQFSVTLSEPAQITFTVQISTTAITAVSPQDYTHVANTLTFLPGQSVKTISVSTLTDTYDEDTETFRVRLYSPQYVFIGDGEGIGTITDGTVMPSISIGDHTITEGDAGNSVQAVFAVTLNSPSGKTVTVDYKTVDGTAVAGDDYLAVQGHVSFAPGVTAQIIAVTIVGDDLREGSETFTLDLSNPVNASVADATGQGTITDDDTPAFSISDSVRAEGNAGTNTMTFSVRLSKPSTQPATVKYITSPGTATAGSDYVYTSGTLTFAAGETIRTVSVTINGDEDVEPHETFTVSLNTPASGTIIVDGAATGTIRDDDRTSFDVYIPLVVRN